SFTPSWACVVGAGKISGRDESEDARGPARGPRPRIGVAHHRGRAVPRGVQSLARAAILAQDPSPFVGDGPTFRAEIADDELDGVEGPLLQAAEIGVGLDARVGVVAVVGGVSTAEVPVHPYPSEPVEPVDGIAQRV